MRSLLPKWFSKFFSTIFIFLAPVVASASVEHFFEDEDPSVYQHVNVISGHLNLAFNDYTLKGPVPFTLRRTFSSAGSLERSSRNTDLVLKYTRKSEWMFQGGWTFLPEANLLMYPYKWCMQKKKDVIYRDEDGQPLCFKAVLREKSGISITYYCFGHENKEVILRPIPESTPSSGQIDPRTDPKNNFLQMIDQHHAILHLPDGSERHYSGDLSKKDMLRWWILEKEVLPSKHQILYHYTDDKSQQLTKIEVKNPKGTKTFASVSLDENRFGREYTLRRHI